MFFPNYQGIEIKCTTRFSRYPISLFSKSFDDPSFFEMNRLINTYGTEDNIYKGRKILMANLKVNEKNIIPALINPDKTKANYDDKIVSAGYEFGLHPGDVFE